MGQSIIRFGEMKVENVIEGNINNYIVFSPLPYGKQHSSGLDNDITISSTPTIEIIDADLDVTIDNKYAFAYSISTDNKFKLVYDKTKYTNKAQVLEDIKCLSVTYELGNLEPVSGNTYYVITRNSLGEEIQRSIALTLQQCLNTIEQFEMTRDITYGGFLKHEVKRAYNVI